MKKSFCFSIMLCISLFANAQMNLDSIVSRIHKNGKSFPEEKVYLHLDNNSYILGDTLRFKAYVTNENELKSKVLYVEIIAPDGYVTARKKYKIDNGSCNGYFELPTKTGSDYYEIRAYTKYMRNWGEDVVFSQIFPVYDNREQKSLSHITENVNKEIELKFYPESGCLVNGITSTIAFELKEKNGKELTDSITIWANEKKISESAPLHEGLGSFELTPQKNVTYSAKIKRNGSTYTFNLPKTKDNGVVITLKEKANENIVFDIKNNIENNINLGYIVLHRGKISSHGKFNSNTKMKTISLSPDDIYEGVNKIIVFNDSFPVAERLFFASKESADNTARQTIKLNIKTNKKQYAPYEKINISITRKDGKPFPENADLSVSVKSKSPYENNGNMENLYSYMLLSSELRDFIPNSKQYFDSNDEKCNKKLNLIMLTHSGTSYNWDKLTAKEHKHILKAERGIELNGFLVKKEKWQDNIIGAYALSPKAGTEIYIKNTDGSLTEKQTTTDEKGYFEFLFDDFYGKKIMELTPGLSSKEKKEKYAITLQKHFTPAIDKQKRETVINRIYKENASHIKKKSHKKHFDFLEEWEFAQDITFLWIDSRSYLLNNYNEKLYRTDYSKFKNNNLDFIRPEFISPSTMEESNSGYKYIPSLDSYSVPNLTAKEISSRRQSLMEETEDEMTAQKVLLSTMWRHRYDWCDWVQMNICADDAYINNKDKTNMMNFKEIIISDNKNETEKYIYSDSISSQNLKKLKKKKKDAMFYEGFLSFLRVPRIYNTGINIGGYPGVKQLYAREIPKHPDYVANFTVNENKENKDAIQAILKNKKKRYTVLQGYSQSIEFNSPDYSSIPTNGIKDNRRTLLWLPEIKAANKTSLDIELYNNSMTNEIVIEVTGIDENNFYIMQ